MGETQALVSIMPWTFIAQIGNLFIQAYLIRRFLFNPVAAVIEKRKNLAERELGEARREKERAEKSMRDTLKMVKEHGYAGVEYAGFGDLTAEEMKAEYEARLAGAQNRISSMLENARREAEAKSRETLQEAREEAGRIREQAQKEIAGERHEAAAQLRQEIGSLAINIASRVVEKELREEDHRRLIREFIENVGEAS